MFKEAYECLKNEGYLCIFPEGTSHDRTDFIKLKAGIALMSLGAMSEFKSKNVKIVPVGINYFRREKFRSEVLIEFGKYFEIPSDWADQFSKNKKEATEKLLKEIEARMKAVTLTAPTYEELRALHLLRKIYVPKGLKLTPTQYSDLCKNFAKGYERVKEIPEYIDNINRINNYVREIDEIALTDHEVTNINFQKALMRKKFYMSTMKFILYFLFILPGYLSILPFLIYCKYKAEKERVIVLF